jgi:hypothetical protein
VPRGLNGVAHNGSGAAHGPSHGQNASAISKVTMPTCQNIKTAAWRAGRSAAVRNDNVECTGATRAETAVLVLQAPDATAFETEPA